MRAFVGRVVVAAALLPAAVAAQDTIPPLERGVRIGITYTPGVRPGMLVLGGPRTPMLDSARAIIGRDLDFGDRFEMITLPMADSLVLSIDQGADTAAAVFVNYPLYAALGADYAVDVRSTADSGVAVAVYDVAGEGLRRNVALPRASLESPGFRLAVHRVSDQVVQAVTGFAGIAATRLLFISSGRVYRIDSDGAMPQALSPQGANAMSPVWSPDVRRIIYMEFVEGQGVLYEQDLEDGDREALPPTREALNFAPAFAPDGHTVAFSRAGPEGSHIFTYNLVDQCCLQRLTVGPLWDNLSPTYSPDGRRIAYVSTRVGLPQIFVMGSDGTGQELFAPFDWGVTGSSNGPEWSPDGLHIAFHREIAGNPQVFVMDVRSRDVRQLTSAGRNEDPTWAPDGRHLAFVSNRTGARQVWIIDLETGRVRRLTRLAEARLPSWSPRIPERNN